MNGQDCWLWLVAGSSPTACGGITWHCDTAAGLKDAYLLCRGRQHAGTCHLCWQMQIEEVHEPHCIHCMPAWCAVCN